MSGGMAPPGVGGYCIVQPSHYLAFARAPIQESDSLFLLELGKSS